MCFRIQSVIFSIYKAWKKGLRQNYILKGVEDVIFVILKKVKINNKF